MAPQEFTIDESFPTLDGKVVVITGASSGIGLAASELFLQNGAIVTMADIKPPPESFKATDKSTYHKMDASSWEDVSAVFKSTYEKHGKIDILFANAGVVDFILGEDILFEELDPQTGALLAPKSRVMDVNFNGYLYATKLALHYFAKNTPAGGKIVMTASTACYLDEPIPMYLASKYAVRGLFRAMRASAPKFSVSINLVAPWMTESSFMPPGARGQLEAMGFPVNDCLSPARAAAFLATGDWNGKTVLVAGNRFKEIEEAFDESRDSWIGNEWVDHAANAGKLTYRPTKSGW